MITIKQALKAIYLQVFPRREIKSTIREQLMYRVYLFDELLSMIGQSQFFQGKRILEIGPKDGLDSKRLASLQPSELVMIDLPEKKEYITQWLSNIQCSHRYIEANFMYIPHEEFLSLGKFDLIWCTGVLYHNAEQLRCLRKLYKLLNIGGYFVLESATLRLTKSLRNGCYVEIHYPQTYRDTGTITHLPTANAINAWLQMVGFQEIYESSCFKKENKDLIGQRYACICKKTGDDNANVYYGKSGLNPMYKFGDSL
jgi:hypothetical protein